MLKFDRASHITSRTKLDAIGTILPVSVSQKSDDRTYVVRINHIVVGEGFADLIMAQQYATNRYREQLTAALAAIPN